MATITEFSAIYATILQAVREDRGLWLEWDNGPVWVDSRDLMRAWEDMELSDPFTVVTGLTPPLGYTEEGVRITHDTAPTGITWGDVYSAETYAINHDACLYGDGIFLCYHPGH